MRSSNETTIIALPFAGGNKYSYNMFEKLIPFNYKWETIELAGRGTRIREALISDMKVLVEDVYEQMESKIKTGNYIIYGHSMGALLGYLLTNKIIELGCKPPKFLFFTGRGGPSESEEKNISNYDSASFWEEVQKMGGLPDDILNNDELLGFFEPILRADFKAIEGYHYQPKNTTFNLPIYIRIGDKEKISEQELMAWQNESKLPINTLIVPGNHFFILDQPDIILKQIIRADLAIV
ncbi:thioesterase II family protein [Aquimarina sp. I32.4]|uniref:thioesterase II family protein n=1 Tax=Aquimarina sp. I32.4 TaxID=2053903 RepID=UPI000CDEA28E|nr:thioesterase domain-containing protein [Aquimarina sp. I32.4]